MQKSCSFDKHTQAGEICLLSQSESQQCLDVPLTFVEIPAYLLCRLHHIKYGHLFQKTLLLLAIKKFQMDKNLSYRISKKIIAIMDHGSWHFEGAMFIENTRYLFDITMKKRQSCRCCVHFNDSCKTFFQLSNSLSYLA